MKPQGQKEFKEVFKRLTIIKSQPTKLDLLSAESDGQKNLRQYPLCILVFKINTTTCMTTIKCWKYIYLHKNIFTHYIKPKCSFSRPFSCLIKFLLQECKFWHHNEITPWKYKYILYRKYREVFTNYISKFFKNLKQYANIKQL
jgi:hypothetical protein